MIEYQHTLEPRAEQFHQREVVNPLPFSVEQGETSSVLQLGTLHGDPQLQFYNLQPTQPNLLDFSPRHRHFK